MNVKYYSNKEVISINPEERLKKNPDALKIKSIGIIEFYLTLRLMKNFIYKFTQQISIPQRWITYSL